MIGRLRRDGAQDEGLRRVAWRLALQTVGLLLVMLIALELVVYLITQQTLLGSLESTVQARAVAPDAGLCSAFHLPCGFSGPGGNPGNGPGGGQPGGGLPVGGQPGGGQGGAHPGGGPFPVSGNGGTGPGPSDASAVYVDTSLRIKHADGSLGAVLLDRQAAVSAIASGDPNCCTVATYEDQQYLVYTAPLRFEGRLVGATQTSISEHQYEDTMETLLDALLVVALLGLLTSSGISGVLVHRALAPIRLSMQRQRDFVADAAHELRTPLAIQRTVGETGLHTLEADDLQATVAQMLGENQHLTRLVEDLSILARADTGVVAIERRPVDLSGLVSETVAELAPLAEAEEVTLASAVTENLHITGDVLRLRQLLLILLDNALKHTPAGGTISVRLSAQSDRARLQVSDSGRGIDSADLPRIFDRFYRADRARTGEGSGLGLSIGKWIVTAHGGQIGASNAAPHGAVFTVTLPLTRA